MDEQNVKYAYNEVLLNNKKNEVSIHITKWMNFKNSLL